MSKVTRQALQALARTGKGRGGTCTAALCRCGQCGRKGRGTPGAGRKVKAA